MTAWLGPEALAEQVPAWRGLEVSIDAELPGLSNRSWLVSVAGQRYVMRTDSAHGRLFDRDRITEVMVLDHAARNDLAPEVIFAHPGSGLLVTRYLDGGAVRTSALDDDAMLVAVARLLKRVHALPRCGRAFDALGAGRRYAAALPATSETAATAGYCLDALSDMPVPETTVLCHNDVIHANIIDGDPLRLVDWEYAADNDPLFDVATVVAYHDLGEATADRLLAAYLGDDDPDARERLSRVMRGYDALHWLWLKARATVTPGDDQRLAQLERRL